MAGFTSSNVSFTSDQISINWPGLSFTTSTVVELDVGTTSVPEPAVIVSLLGMGLLGASSVFLRQRRVALATQG
jgi:cobalamin biosynthesis protein CbiG